MNLREAWESQAEAWARWARTPDHDHFFWRYNLPCFLELVPEPGQLTLDVGCGEGRLARALASRGHTVIGIDGSPTLARLAATHEEPVASAAADAAALPVASGIADLVVAFMSLQDIDDLEGSVCEAARVLRPGGVFCIANLHPIVTAGAFEDDSPDSRFVISRAYAEPFRSEEPFTRDGLTMVFHSMHRPVAAYTRALHDAAFLVDVLAEPAPPGDLLRDFPQMGHQARIPWWLHLRAIRQ
jgi:SAM-dependent methyltransferase